MWNLFKKHHYLTEQINKASRVFIAKWQDKIVGFNAVLPMPSGTLKNAWREHRLVILSDFQGLGFGNTLSEATGELLKKAGKRYFSKTANIKLGEYRNGSKLWKPTSKNGKRRLDVLNTCEEYGIKVNKFLLKRVCYSHEYIGDVSIKLEEK